MATKIKKKILMGSKDLAASINQTTADKLLDSVNFPLTLVNVTNPPPGNLLSTKEVNDDEVILAEAIVKQYLKEIAGSVSTGSTKSPNSDNRFYSEALSNLSGTIENAQAYLNARKKANEEGKEFEGPDEEYAIGIRDGGIEGLVKIKGIEFKAICSKLQVIADNKPNLSLNGSKVSVSNSKITTQATGELWWYHPTIHCSRWCTRWSVSWSWSRIASVSISVRVDLDGYVEIIVNGKILNAKLHINKLRLDYPILREIPLEGIANRVLSGKQIPIFDAGSFVASVPIINSKFAIDIISIPNTTGSIDIDIAIKQV
jgi:hypothetical protein